jgi:hypothetical protein
MAPPYRPRRPETSPLYRVVADHFATLERVHEERFEPTHGPLRAAARVGAEAPRRRPRRGRWRQGGLGAAQVEQLAVEWDAGRA